MTVFMEGEFQHPVGFDLKISVKNDMFSRVASAPFNMEEAYNDLVNIHKNDF